jgi:hypothetical protein
MDKDHPKLLRRDAMPRFILKFFLRMWLNSNSVLKQNVVFKNEHQIF